MIEKRSIEPDGTMRVQTTLTYARQAFAAARARAGVEEGRVAEDASSGRPETARVGPSREEQTPIVRMINRREFLGITLGAGAALALTPELLRALQQSGGKLIQRAIPSSGEMLPVIGLAFANHPRARIPPRSRRSSRRWSTTAAESSTRCTAAPAAEQVARHGCQRARDSEQDLLVDARALPSARRPPQPGAAAVKAQIEA